MTKKYSVTRYVYTCKNNNCKRIVEVYTDLNKEDVRPKVCSCCGGTDFKESQKEKQSDACPDEGQASTCLGE